MVLTASSRTRYSEDSKRRKQRHREGAKARLQDLRRSFTVIYGRFGALPPLAMGGVLAALGSEAAPTTKKNKKQQRKAKNDKEKQQKDTLLKKYALEKSGNAGLDQWQHNEAKARRANIPHGCAGAMRPSPIGPLPRISGERGSILCFWAHSKF